MVIKKRGQVRELRVKAVEKKNGKIKVSNAKNMREKKTETRLE